MSRYKSFSVHSGICGIHRAFASAAALITAAALPLTILGVGTVGALLFKVSRLSAQSMMPPTAEAVFSEPEEESFVSQPEEEDPVSSEEAEAKKAS